MSKATRAFAARSRRVPVWRSVGRRPREQIGEKEGAQGFGGLKAHARKKAREGRAGGQFSAVEQGHEGLRRGEESLVTLLQGAFATDGVAEEYGEKVDHLVVPKAATSKAHLRGDGVEDAQLTKMLDDEHDFPQPTGGRGDSFGSGLDDHRRISDTGHVYLLVGKVLYPSLKGGTFYACPLQTISRCAIRGHWDQPGSGRMHRSAHPMTSLSPRALVLTRASLT